MIIVLGSVVAKGDYLEELVTLSLKHVKRSRSEQGCIFHAVHLDTENPLQLVFVEKWESRKALEEHFALRTSRDFVRKVRKLAAEPPNMEIYEAEVTLIRSN